MPVVRSPARLTRGAIAASRLVHNLSEQSDSSELLGGFRPVQMRQVFGPLASRFEDAFVRTFSRSKNAAFLQKFALNLANGKWPKLLSLMRTALKIVYARISAASPAAPPTTVAAAEPAAEAVAVRPRKKRRGSSGEAVKAPAAAATTEQAAEATEAGEAAEALSDGLREEWEELSAQVARLQKQLEKPEEGGIAFAFVEGSLVKALREGHWMLLDEINLAAPETLERIAAVLEENGSVALTERGDAHVVTRHPDFRIFGAMNPPTDFGKKDLPPGIRSRFTELYVDPISSHEDIQLVVLQQLSHVLPHPPVQVNQRRGRRAWGVGRRAYGSYRA